MTDSSLDLALVRERFESSTDFTIGIEEEFAIVDPQTLEPRHAFEELYAACQRDELLAESAAGELIASEIEIRSGRGETFADAVERQRRNRSRLFALAEDLGLGLGAMGTHPWANYLDQRIIDTPHYQRLASDLGYVAQRNNTWSLHVHVGIRGAERAVAVCDRVRDLLPLLLAVSANSPFLDGRDTGLHSVRSEIFTRTFPRCGIPEPFGSWAAYADFVRLLERTRSVVEPTQLWWSIRPHHAFGTVEVRICDAQTNGTESFALAGLIAAVVAQTALDVDQGRAAEPLRQRENEENLWRAIRYGMDGRMIDFGAGEEIEARAALERLLHWVDPARAAFGFEIELPAMNGAQRSLRRLGEGDPIAEIYRGAVAEARRSYAPERTPEAAAAKPLA